MAKSTQDLCVFLRELSEVRNREVVVTVYPNKSFVLYETSPEATTLEPIYQSDNVSDCLDINDLPYEDTIDFSKHIDELASVNGILAEDPSSGRVGKYDDV